ncbi:DoxX family protein [Runella slithyformis]|uniref:DoxX family membrane protein n=1 Tax=Runella slithyformis (strain ATCC 29530 / DSM 19594 / LMG 11500 / NCIMB 11436 / LSU 4) TaxID=761193 RepID=A0A7U3ZHI6_RUNSL|nr:DoxX family membrane protein [Runella slithyformis]AEI47352.1 hypothetical protein Runsl_0915 [Runella slithyformis DSM 19594]
MKIAKLILTYLFGAFMVFGGVNHFLKPEMYAPFIPAFLPNDAVNYLAGIIEIVLGIGVFIPKFRSQATLGILAMMLVFLPLHVIDIFKAQPAIGSHQLALIRLPLQFLLIGWAWFIHKK